MALGTLLSLAACPADRSTGGLTREQYVDLYVSILRAADAARDSVAATDSARRILAEHGFTEDDLLQFADRYASEPQTLTDIWAEIERRLQQPAEEETEEPADTTDEGGPIRKPRRLPIRQ